jgi:hypothetical protein
MRALDRLWAIARSWLRNRHLDEELAEELRFHLEREAEANVAAGMAPEAARRAARLALEGMEQIKEDARAERLVGEGEPERLLGARVSPNRAGRENVVLLSDAFWKRRFGGDPSIVGRAILLSGTPHVVVGVMRPDFQYPGGEFQVWTPLTINPAELARQESGYNYPPWLACARESASRVRRPSWTRSHAGSRVPTRGATLRWASRRRTCSKTRFAPCGPRCTSCSGRSRACCSSRA